ncbi:hypothetical protein [Ruegeria arenilitoris]|uniref:hypothetical protein n=1 Tax=Ruegeria arenilitoris TaxID=1173585 RepID=UPI0014804534|nr:hypothetical protein [Ruegeria arenilitoris]
MHCFKEFLARRALFATLLFFPLSAQACFVCDEIVELDNVRAACFLEQYPEFEKRISETGDGRGEVDLTECANDVADGTRGIDWFTKLPNPTGSTDPNLEPIQELRSVFILDETDARCLKAFLEGLDRPIDPTVRVDLTEMCDSK